MVLRFFGHDFLKPLALSLTFTRGRWLFHWCFLQGMPPLLWCTADLAQCLDWRPGMWPAVSRFRGIWRKKRDVFWILKIYVEYKIKRRFNKNGCVVFHCVFVGHVFFSRCENRCRRGVGSATKNCLLLKSRWTFPWLASTQAAQLRVRVKVAKHLVSTGWKVQMCGEVHQVHANQYEKYEKCDVSYILWFWYDVLDFFGTYNSTV